MIRPLHTEIEPVHRAAPLTVSSNGLEPRWPAMLALLAVGGLRLALPAPLSVGPSWLLLLLVGILLVPTTLARQFGDDRLNQVLGYLMASVVTVEMIWSLALLLLALPAHREGPRELLYGLERYGPPTFLSLRHGTGLDAGGPRAREQRGVHTDGAFLFPQMKLDQQTKRTMGEQILESGIH